MVLEKVLKMPEPRRPGRHVRPRRFTVERVLEAGLWALGAVVAYINPVMRTRWMSIVFALLAVFGVIYLVIGTWMYLVVGFRFSWGVIGFGFAFWSLAGGILGYFRLHDITTSREIR